MQFSPIPRDFGTGGSGLEPRNGRPDLRTLLAEHSAGLGEHDARIVTLEGHLGPPVKSVSFVWDPAADPWAAVLAQPPYVKELYVLGQSGVVPPGRWELPGVRVRAGEPGAVLELAPDAVLRGLAGVSNGLQLDVRGAVVYAPWQVNRTYARGDLVAALPAHGTHPGVYRCTVPGRSAPAGNGPYGVGAADLLDGAVHWEFYGGGGSLDWAFNFPDHVGPTTFTAADGAVVSAAPGRAVCVVPDTGIFVFATPNGKGFQAADSNSRLAHLGDGCFLVWLPTGWTGGDSYQFEFACDGPATALFGILHAGLPGPYGVPPAPGFLGTSGQFPLGLDGGSGPTAQRPQSLFSPLDGIGFYDMDLKKQLLHDDVQWNALTMTGPV